MIMVETGLSDFRKLIITAMKVRYNKQKSRIIQCRSYYTFRKDSFNEELNDELLKIDINSAEFSDFGKSFVSFLNKRAPKKRQWVRPNNN